MTFGSWERTEEEAEMSKALEKVANEIGAKSVSAGEIFVSVSSCTGVVNFHSPFFVKLPLPMSCKKRPTSFPSLAGVR